MRALAYFVLTVSLVSCANPQHSIGEEPGQVSEQGEIEPLLQLPTVIAAEFDDSGYNCRVTVLNDTGRPLLYYGYKQGHIFWHHDRWIGEQWQDEYFGWCGTGANYHQLKAGDSADFDVYFPQAKGPWRVYAYFSDLELRESEVVLAVRPD